MCVCVDYRCACSHCVIMNISKKCICCQEIMKMKEKMEEAEIPALLSITGHPGLHAVCLNVLTLPYYQYRQEYGSATLPLPINE